MYPAVGYKESDGFANVLRQSDPAYEDLEHVWHDGGLDLCPHGVRYGPTLSPVILRKAASSFSVRIVPGEIALTVIPCRPPLGRRLCQIVHGGLARRSC